MAIDGGRLAAKTLKEAGVETVFALHGGHLDTFLTGCHAEGIRLVDCRHEAAAVNAADGYARVTGKIGVAAVTSGPGLTNAIAGITNSAADRTPVLVITSSSPIREMEMGELQGGLDLIAMLHPTTKFAHKILATERVQDLVGLGIRKALNGSLWALLLLIFPIDIAFTPVDEASLPKAGSPIPLLLAQPMPSPSCHRRGDGNVIASAERPILVVGEGMDPTEASARSALKVFAERTGIPVFQQKLGVHRLTWR